jgi:putative DNA primase/helicase
MNARPQQCRDRCCDNGAGRQDKRRKSQTDTLALSPEFSEDRIALSFVDRFENSFRYVAALGKWFGWDNARWRIHDKQIARDRVRAVCREASSHCNQQKQAKLLASAKTVSAVERLASTD